MKMQNYVSWFDFLLSLDNMRSSQRDSLSLNAECSLSLSYKRA